MKYGYVAELTQNGCDANAHTHTHYDTVTTENVKLHKYYIRTVSIENLSHACLIKTEGEQAIVEAKSTNPYICMEYNGVHKINNDDL